MELAGYIASLLIGISLGLIGGGGSILTVPVMVYLFGIPPVAATSYSLFVVGSTSLVGAVQQYKRGLVNIRTSLLFSLTSVVSVLITRHFLLPLIPARIATIQGYVITENLLTMVLFALLMVIASVFMMRGNKTTDKPATHDPRIHLWKLLLYGTGIGMVTGLLGAGGGFLLIPSLVLLLHLPMKEAIGTSLLVIAINSLIGFTGDLHNQSIHWSLLLTVTGLAIAGIMAGSWLNRRVPAGKLKKMFAWFVLTMGVYILVSELLRAIP